MQLGLIIHSNAYQQIPQSHEQVDINITKIIMPLNQTKITHKSPSTKNTTPNSVKAIINETPYNDYHEHYASPYTAFLLCDMVSDYVNVIDNEDEHADITHQRYIEKCFAEAHD